MVVAGLLNKKVDHDICLADLYKSTPIPSSSIRVPARGLVPTSIGAELVGAYGAYLALVQGAPNQSGDHDEHHRQCAKANRNYAKRHDKLDNVLLRIAVVTCMDPRLSNLPEIGAAACRYRRYPNRRTRGNRDVLGELLFTRCSERQRSCSSTTPAADSPHSPMRVERETPCAGLCVRHGDRSPQRSRGSCTANCCLTGRRSFKIESQSGGGARYAWTRIGPF